MADPEWSSNFQGLYHFHQDFKLPTVSALNVQGRQKHWTDHLRVI